jgi:hypothetical protein
VRRTSTIDSTWSQLVPGRVDVDARARDLRTGPDGSGQVLGEFRMRAVVDYVDRARLLEIDSDPAVPALQSLLGLSARSGFRAEAVQRLPDEAAAKSLLNLLLDDLPGAMLVSGYAGGRLADDRGMSPQQRAADARRVNEALSSQADLCSGWRSGGTIMIDIDRGDAPPMVTGPPASGFRLDDDPVGWHQTEPLAAHSMRRLRRLDLIPGEPQPVDVYFRDSHMSADGEETSIHEYSVTGAVREGLVVALEAVPRALPWVECPHAAASATWVVGNSVTGLRPRVRAEFTGIDTCTHLNDVLRSLEDIEVLGPMLGPAPDRP